MGNVAYFIPSLFSRWINSNGSTERSDLSRVGAQGGRKVLGVGARSKDHHKRSNQSDNSPWLRGIRAAVRFCYRILYAGHRVWLPRKTIVHPFIVAHMGATRSLTISHIFAQVDWPCLISFCIRIFYADFLYTSFFLYKAWKLNLFTKEDN